MASTRLPPEILGDIFSNVGLHERQSNVSCADRSSHKLIHLDDLAAVCSSCREWNLWATPLLYRRMHIWIRDPDASQDTPQVWIAALRGLQDNNRQQRQAVHSLAIRGGFSPLGAFGDEGPVDLSRADDLLHDLLRASMEGMPRLNEFMYAGHT